MLPLCWAPPRALGRTPARRFFPPAPILRRPLLAGCLPSRRPPPGSWPRPRFMSQAMKYLSEDLESFKEDKWGWIIYRTSYKDDAAWELFKTRLATNWTRLRDDLDGDVPPAVRRAMDWTCISDRATLDGATRAQLRARFRAWRETAVRGENPRRDLADNAAVSQRYRYFLQVDDASLQSVAEGDGKMLDGSWVNLVRCDDEMDGYIKMLEEDKEREARAPRGHEDEEVDGSEPDEGPEDAWWMMISTDMIHYEFYMTLGSSLESWWVYYQEPPEVLWQ